VSLSILDNVPLARQLKAITDRSAECSRRRICLSVSLRLRVAYESRTALNRMHYIFIDIRRRPRPQPLLTRSRPKNFKTRGFVSRLGISRRCSDRSIPVAQRTELLPCARSDSAAFAAIRSTVIHRDYGEPRRRRSGFQSNSHTRNQRPRDMMKHRMIGEGGGGALATRSRFALPRTNASLREFESAKRARSAIASDEF